MQTANTSHAQLWFKSLPELSPPLLQREEEGGKVDGREPFFRGSRNFSLGKIEQKDGNQSPSIVLFDGLKNHGARV
jgi:hypothetical protein